MRHPAKRRVFFGSEEENFQLFSIEQNRNDGSIYFSAPAFEDIQWLIPAQVGDESPVLLSFQAGGSGKLSLHGTGVVHVNPYESQRLDQFSIPGNILGTEKDENLSVRHLLTIFPSEPTHKPSSPASNRRSDWLISTTAWHPYVLVIWAVPLRNLTGVSISGSFKEDELEEVPPNAGWGGFPLGAHLIVWFAYRTKHMSKWPKFSQACYHDGFHVPLLIGTGPGQFRLEYSRPQYEIEKTKLRIVL